MRLARANHLRDETDCKLNAFSCLIAPEFTCKSLEWACIEALQTCRNVAAGVKEEIASAIDELSQHCESIEISRYSPQDLRQHRYHARES